MVLRTKSHSAFIDLGYRGNGWGKKSVSMPMLDFPGGAVVKNLPAKAGNTGSSSGPGRSHMSRSN